MKIITIALITVAFAVSVLSQTSLKVGAQAPSFSGAALDGTIYKLDDLRGKTVVLTFWSSRCAICRSELPKLNQVVKGFEGKNVVFLSLTMENESIVEAYIKTNRVEARILPNSFGVVLQYADRDRNGNLDMGFPSFFVVDNSGRINYRAGGYDKTEALSTAIARLVAK